MLICVSSIVGKYPGNRYYLWID